MLNKAIVIIKNIIFKSLPVIAGFVRNLNTSSFINKTINYFNAFIKNKEVKEYADKKLIANDLISARNRDAIISKLKGSNKRANFITFFIIFFLCFFTFLLFFYINEISGEGVAIIGAIIGVLAKCLYRIFIFEFGNDQEESEIDLNYNSGGVNEETSKYETEKPSNKKNKNK